MSEIKEKPIHEEVGIDLVFYNQIVLQRIRKGRSVEQVCRDLNTNEGTIKAVEELYRQRFEDA